MTIEGRRLVRRRSIEEIEIKIPEIGTILKTPHSPKVNRFDAKIKSQEVKECPGEVKVFNLVEAFDGLFVLGKCDKCKFETMEEV